MRKQPNQIKITKEFLELEYGVKGKSIPEIAQEFNYSVSTLYPSFKKFKIKLRPKTAKGVDISGQKFGCLTAINRIKDTKGYLWKCQCDCDEKNIVLAKVAYLRSGMIKSCGCYKKRFTKGGNKHHLWTGCGNISGMYWKCLKRRGRARGYKFNISVEYAWNLFLEQNGQCSLSGIELKFVNDYKNDKTQTASLDRIDNTKGYIQGNVQWVHKMINYMKYTLTQQDFLNYCQQVVIHNKLKGFGR